MIHLKLREKVSFVSTQLYVYRHYLFHVQVTYLNCFLQY